MSSLFIENAQISSSTEVFTGSLLIQQGKISHIYRNASTPQPPPPQNIPRLDAQGLYLLPGGVDPHTHFDLDVGFTRASDDFYTGTIAAACGGTTTIIDHMAFGPPGCALSHQAGVYRQLAQRAVIDYGFHGVIQHVNDAVLADMQTLREEGITSHKVYLTYDLRLQDGDILRVLTRAKELGLTICAHCENDAIIASLRESILSAGKTTPRYHPLSRPAEAEAEAVFRMLMLARVAHEAKVYIVHLSSQLGLDAVRLARAAGQQNIYAESCPQYLFLDDSLYNNDQEGLKYIISPPLRKPADEAALWQGISAKDIDTIGTDHCPFFFETQKQRGAQNFTLAPGGAPGVELRMPLMFSEGFLAGRISLPRMVQLCCTRPAELFGISPQKGDIRIGADADLVLFDPKPEYTVTKALLHENTDYTPYEGMRLRGKPVMTFSRGELVVQNGQFIGQQGRGKYLRRSV